MPPTIEQELQESLGKLRAMAILISRDRNVADDLVQDTIVRILAARDSYTPGSNFLGWAYRIMRNRHISRQRRRRFNTVPLDHPAALAVGRPGNQETGIVRAEVEAALMRLPLAQREALMLVGAAEMSYEEAARVFDCSIGTVKSRVSRGREALRRALAPEDEPVTRPVGGAEQVRASSGSNHGIEADGRQIERRGRYASTWSGT